jgi:hypothetical protein
MADTHAHTSLDKSSHETAKYLSSHLRNEATAAGWPDHIVSGMKVHYHEGEFKIAANKKHTKEINDLEYGTQDSRPTAAMRRFSNDTSEAEEFLVGRMLKHMGGEL